MTPGAGQQFAGYTVVRLVGAGGMGEVFLAQHPNIHVADYGYKRVLKLPAGSSTPVTLPSVGLNSPVGVAADSADNVYVIDVGNRDLTRVLKLRTAA